MEEHKIKVIARIRSDFDEKFGIPRQSGLAASAKAEVIFEPEFRDPEAVRGLEGFSHIWLLWQFSKAVRSEWSPTVRPPRLGGNARMGVFATRSPFRPNSIGLSCVRLERVELDAEHGPVLHVSGADLMNGTPIYDVKPYVKYADSHEDAVCGFVDGAGERLLEVDFPEELLYQLPEDKRQAVIEVLAHDPRPQYQSDGERIYGMSYGGMNIKFTVFGGKLTVIAVEPPERR